MTPSVPEELRQTATALLEQCGRGPLLSITPLAGGRNNRIYRVTGSQATGILKQYFDDGTGGRDRWASEVAWSEFCETHQIDWTPPLWASDRAARCGLFAELPGRNLQQDDVTMDAVRQAAKFVRDVNQYRQTSEATALPLAAEAFFSLADHAAGIQRRLDRLMMSPNNDELDVGLKNWLRTAVAPVWQTAQQLMRAGLNEEEWQSVLPIELQCLSPSDFGFHNVWRLPSGELRFLDFEYAGWDDPAKLICDFYWQIDLPVPRDTWQLLTNVFAEESLMERVRRLFPAQGIKWCCIVLNEFLPADQRRRRFADHTAGDRRPQQWDIARKLLEDVQRVIEHPWPPVMP